MEPQHRKIAKRTRQHARTMRHETTVSERKLWHLLRSRRREHLKFRRQAPIGIYITDLVCHQQKLIIEVDGSQHVENARDAERDAWLESAGYRVVRLWNNDVLTNPSGIFDLIISLTANEGKTPSPGTPSAPPSPSRGEG